MNDTPADAITQGVDVFAERKAFEAWWMQWVPDGTMPSLTSHIFDAWLASARHRTTSIAAQDGLVDAVRGLRANDGSNGTYHALKCYEYGKQVDAALASIEQPHD